MSSRIEQFADLGLIASPAQVGQGSNRSARCTRSSVLDGYVEFVGQGLAHPVGSEPTPSALDLLEACAEVGRPVVCSGAA
jgi:hypothetical protein